MTPGLEEQRDDALLSSEGGTHATLTHAAPWRYVQAPQNRADPTLAGPV